jgi:hypothetical protein
MLMVIKGFRFTETVLGLTVVISVSIFFVYLYRQNAFELHFTDSYIVQVYPYKNFIQRYEYSSLSQIWIAEGRTPFFRLHFNLDGKEITAKADWWRDVEETVELVQWLKTKAPHFETHVTNKGTVLHMRLRQQLLSKEY